MFPRALVNNPITISKHRGFNHNKLSVKIHSGSRGCTGSQPYSDSLFEQSKLVVTADVFSSLLKPRLQIHYFGSFRYDLGWFGNVLEWFGSAESQCISFRLNLVSKITSEYSVHLCKLGWCSVGAKFKFCTTLVRTNHTNLGGFFFHSWTGVSISWGPAVGIIHIGSTVAD